MSFPNKKIIFILPKFFLVLATFLSFLNIVSYKNTVYAATITWDGGGTDETCGGIAGDGNKWSCAANWDTDSVPTSSDVTTFDGTSTKDVTLDTDTTVAGVDINSGYTGTVTQAAAITIGSSGYAQDDGVFAGGSDFIDINDNGITLGAGANFTSTSGTVYIERDLTIDASATFDDNSGNITFDSNSMTTTDISNLYCGGNTLPNVTINKHANYVIYTHNVVINSDCTVNLGDNAVTKGGILWNYGTLLVGTGTWTLNM